MSFRERLKGIVEGVDGGVGAVIMGYDGIAIDEYVREGASVDVQLMAVEYSALLRDVRKTIEVLDAGGMDEVSINTGLFRTVIRVINDDFFVVLALDREGNYGKGRYLLKRDAPAFREALS